MKKQPKSTVRKIAGKVAKHVTNVTRTEGKKLARTLINDGIQSIVSATGATTEPEPATPDFKAGRDL